METQPRWLADDPLPAFAAVDRAMRADVAVVGGGIMGITAAYLLKRAGLKVILLERDRLGHGDTGHTTAHLTYVTDERLSQLVSAFGRSHAEAAWDANNAGLRFIEETVRREGIACDYQMVPGFLHLPRGAKVESKQREQLVEEAQIARDFGFDALFMESSPLMDRPAIRFERQGEFHVLKYLAALAKTIPGGGSHIFEESEAVEFSEKPVRIKCRGKWITCKWIVIATHVPLQGETGTAKAALFQTKLYPYSSYAVGAKVPRECCPPACFWDTGEPYDYLRIDRQRAHSYAIYGGADHKTGQATDTEARYKELEKKLLAVLPKAKIERHWSGQVVETNDGLPFIGEMVPKQFIGTGFAGNGMTFGTLAAMMACDAITGRKNPWAELFDVHRKKVRGGAWDYVKENADYPYYLLKDRLRRAEGTSIDEVGRGEGKILKIDGNRVACHRTDDGKLVTVSPVCTHMGCLVHWNGAEKTWDCPCHGSRFKATGEVIGGPAETPLAKKAMAAAPPRRKRAAIKTGPAARTKRPSARR